MLIPWYTIDRSETARQRLEVRCPRCHDEIRPAAVWRERERFLLFGDIPLFSRTSTQLECKGCHRRFASPVEVVDLLQLSADEIGEQLRRTATSFEWYITTIGTVVGIVPVNGWIVVLIALALTWKAPRWTKFALLSSLVLGIVLTVIL